MNHYILFHAVRRKDNEEGWWTLTLDVADAETARRTVWRNFDKVSSFQMATSADGVAEFKGRMM